jgi:hypothetical protein
MQVLFTADAMTSAHTTEAGPCQDYIDLSLYRSSDICGSSIFLRKRVPERLQHLDHLLLLVLMLSATTASLQTHRNIYLDCG